MTGETINVAGIDVHVVSDDEAEKAGALVCMRKGALTPFNDNLEAPCSACGETVIFRPHSPKAPPKLCLECAIGMTGLKQ